MTRDVEELKATIKKLRDISDNDLSFGEVSETAYQRIQDAISELESVIDDMQSVN